MGAMARIREAVAREGAGGLARSALDRVKTFLWLDEDHVWYELPVAEATSPGPFGEGVELIKATPEDAERVTVLGRSVADAQERLAGGNDLWLVTQGDRTAFCCFIFRGRTPVLAARGGWLEIPPGRVCLEDSLANPEFRGQGIAPKAWAGIAASLQSEGVEAMITKVGVENAPSRKAVTKAGFREVAVQRVKRRGPLVRVRVEVLDESGGRELARRLER